MKFKQHANKALNEFIPHQTTIVLVFFTIILQTFLLNLLSNGIIFIETIPLIGWLIALPLWLLLAALSSLWFFGTIVVVGLIGLLAELYVFKKDKNRGKKALGTLLLVVFFSYFIEILLG